MKTRSLFDLLTDARDVVDFFERVETSEQMVSRLERIKRGEADDFLTCVEALRVSIEAALEDTLELSAGLESEEDGLEDLSDLDLNELEKQNPTQEPTAEKEKEPKNENG